jgi:hypothetical protein
MALFKDNDREKVNEEIDLEDEDSLDDEEDLDKDKDEDIDQDDDSKDQDKDEDKKKIDEDQKPKVKPEETAEYWKEKFANSTREAQIEFERRKQAEKERDELAKPKEITDDLMKEKYPDWDNYDDAVKATLKNQIKLEQEVTTLKQSQNEYLNERKWDNQIKSFLDENEETEVYSIKDKDAFKKFCNKADRKGMNLDVLAKAYLFEAKDEDNPAPKKGSMLENGSGQGASKKHTTDKKEYTADDAKRLRQNNPKEYERLVKSGALDIKI